MCKQPPGSGRADPHTAPFVSCSDCCCSTGAGAHMRSPLRFDLELREAGGGILFQKPADPQYPTSIQSGATQGQCETSATRTRPDSVLV